MDDLPFNEKVGPHTALGVRMPRPTCRCCGGSCGIRRAWRRMDKFDSKVWPWEGRTKGKKPKAKDHR